jgi:hypothetical protein
VVEATYLFKTLVGLFCVIFQTIELFENKIDKHKRIYQLPEDIQMVSLLLRGIITFGVCELTGEFLDLSHTFAHLPD